MVLISAALGGHVNLACAASELGSEQTTFDLEFLERIDGWKQVISGEIDVRVLDAIQRVVVERDALPAYREREVAPSPAHPDLRDYGRARIGGRARDQGG